MTKAEVGGVALEEVCPVYRKALEEGAKLDQVLAPFVGSWVALSLDWARVVASDPDLQRFMQKAREVARGGAQLRIMRA